MVLLTFRSGSFIFLYETFHFCYLSQLSYSFPQYILDNPLILFMRFWLEVSLAKLRPPVKFDYTSAFSNLINSTFTLQS